MRFHHPKGPFSVKQRRTQWEGHHGQPRQEGSSRQSHSGSSADHPSLSTPAAVNCLVSPSDPVLGCEPGWAEPDVAQNPALTQASPGRGPEQGQQTGPLGLSAPPGPFLDLPWKAGGGGSGGGQRNSIFPECRVHLCKGSVNIQTTGVGCSVHKCVGSEVHETTCCDSSGLQSPCGGWSSSPSLATLAHHLIQVTQHLLFASTTAFLSWSENCYPLPGHPCKTFPPVSIQDTSGGLFESPFD